MVLIANALHVMPEPEKALKEIDRVLKDKGILIAPEFRKPQGRLHQQALVRYFENSRNLF